MKIKIFSTNYMPEQEKYERFAAFENELNQFIQGVKVVDIKFSTSSGLCHDTQTHVNEYMDEMSVLVMYEDKPKTTSAAKKKA